MAELLHSLTGGSMFHSAENKGLALEKEFTGQNYNYAKYVATPSDLGVSSKGTLDALSSNVSAIMDYTKLLAEGGGPASKNGGEPLGDRYFITTSGKCTTADGKSVKRSLYIDNVPTGDIAFLSSLTGSHTTSMKGLIPGLLLDAQKLNPLELMSAFSSNSSPKCTQIHAKTIDENNKKGTAKGYVVDREIKKLSPCVFVDGENPISKTKCQSKESFINANKILRGEKLPRLQIPRNKPLANIYTASLSALLIYIIYKLVHK